MKELSKVVEKLVECYETWNIMMRPQLRSTLPSVDFPDMVNTDSIQTCHKEMKEELMGSFN